jgi:diguanylate cyclase
LGGPVESSGEPCVAYATDRARWLTSELAAPAQVGGVTIAVEASAGVVVESAATCDMAELLRRADVALHLAKGEPSRTFVYDASHDASSKDRLALLADLRDGLSTTDQFVLHIQPIVDLTGGTTIGVEALVRWRHPRRGLLPPAEFIAAVEHSDLASGFTRHVIDMALRLASGWAGQGLNLPISVNLCARCMLDPELPQQVAGLLAAHGLRPQQLILEITESVAYAEAGLAERVVRGLRDLGVQVSVDDFGTGAASLSFLSRFPVNEVKLDRTWIAAMVDSPAVAAIVRTTVDLARDLGMRIVAEGVETPEQRAALIELGVAAAQGYLFHAPLPADDVYDVLRGTPAPAVPPIPVPRMSRQDAVDR